MAEFDINKVQGNDRFIAGGAVALFILSFFPWYAVSSPAFRGITTGKTSANMWHAYGTTKLAWFLAIAAGALVIARLMGVLDSVQLPAGVNLITLGLSGLASVIFLLRFLTAFKSQHVLTVTISEHPSFGWYLGLLVSFAMTFFAYLNFKSSGEELPSKPAGLAPPATPPGYAPPPPPAPPTAPMTPQSNVAPPTEAIPAPPPPPAPGPGGPGYPTTGP